MKKLGFEFVATPDAEQKHLIPGLIFPEGLHENDVQEIKKLFTATKIQRNTDISREERNQQIFLLQQNETS